MAKTVIDFGHGDTMEIVPPEEAPEVNGEKLWHIAVWREYPKGSEPELLNERYVRRIGHADYEVFGMLYITISSNAADRIRSKIERVLAELARQDPRKKPRRHAVGAPSKDKENTPSLGEENASGNRVKRDTTEQSSGFNKRRRR